MTINYLEHPTHQNVSYSLRSLADALPILRRHLEADPAVRPLQLRVLDAQVEDDRHAHLEADRDTPVATWRFAATPRAKSMPRTFLAKSTASSSATARSFQPLAHALQGAHLPRKGREVPDVEALNIIDFHRKVKKIIDFHRKQ